jgi:hypothetical protein
MILLLKNNLNCQKLCEKINELINRELKGAKDFNDYALTINISKIVDEEKTKFIPLLEKTDAVS